MPDANYMKSNGTFINFADASERITSAIRTIETEHAYIHEGIFFESYNKFTLAAGATRFVTLKAPAGVYLHYRPTNLVTSADKVTIEFYEGATVTANTGTAVTPSNHNRNSALTSVVTLLDAPTVTANGIKFAQVYIPGATGIGGMRTGASAGESESEWVFKPDTQYAIKVTNGSSGSNDIQINFQWYEESKG